MVGAGPECGCLLWLLMLVLAAGMGYVVGMPTPWWIMLLVALLGPVLAIALSIGVDETKARRGRRALAQVLRRRWDGLQAVNGLPGSGLEGLPAVRAALPEAARALMLLRAVLAPAPGEAWAALAADAEGDQRLRLADEAALRGVPAIAAAVGDGPLAQCHAAVAAAESDAGQAHQAYAVLERQREALPLVSLCLLEHRLARATGDRELAERVRERALTRPVEDALPEVLSEAWRELTARLAATWPAVEPTLFDNRLAQDRWGEMADRPPPEEVWPGDDAPWADKLAAAAALRDRADEEGAPYQLVQHYLWVLWACRPGADGGDAGAQWLELLDLVDAAPGDGIRGSGLSVVSSLIDAAREGRGGLTRAGQGAELLRRHLAIVDRLETPLNRTLARLDAAAAHGLCATPETTEPILASLVAERDPLAWRSFPWKGLPFILRLDPRHRLKPWLLHASLHVSRWQYTHAAEELWLPWPETGPTTWDDGVHRLGFTLAGFPNWLARTASALPSDSEIRFTEGLRVLLVDTETRGHEALTRRYRDDATNALQSWARSLP